MGAPTILYRKRPDWPPLVTDPYFPSKTTCIAPNVLPRAIRVHLRLHMPIARVPPLPTMYYYLCPTNTIVRLWFPIDLPDYPANRFGERQQGLEKVMRGEFAKFALGMMISRQKLCTCTCLASPTSQTAAQKWKQRRRNPRQTSVFVRRTSISPTTKRLLCDALEMGKTRVIWNYSWCVTTTKWRCRLPQYACHRRVLYRNR